jgi:hypothetical protein
MASFNSAFAAARKAGKSVFTWEGKRYNTKVASTGTPAKMKAPGSRPAKLPDTVKVPGSRPGEKTASTSKQADKVRKSVATAKPKASAEAAKVKAAKAPVPAPRSTTQAAKVRKSVASAKPKAAAELAKLKVKKAASVKSGASRSTAGKVPGLSIGSRKKVDHTKAFTDWVRGTNRK